MFKIQAKTLVGATGGAFGTFDIRKFEIVSGYPLAGGGA
jgi:hypothetical protein